MSLTVGALRSMLSDFVPDDAIIVVQTPLNEPVGPGRVDIKSVTFRPGATHDVVTLEVDPG